MSNEQIPPVGQDQVPPPPGPGQVPPAGLEHMPAAGMSEAPPAAQQTGQKLWSKPWFIVAAVVTALLVGVGSTAAVLALTGGGTDQNQSQEAEPSDTGGSEQTGTDSSDKQDENNTDSSKSASGDNSDSVCGLEGVKMSGTLSKAPDTTWVYKGEIAHPTSKEFGPGETSSPHDVRYCFQRSPEGALFAAGNAIAQADDPDWHAFTAWVSDFLSERTPGRDEFLSELFLATGKPNPPTIIGFKLLDYDGNTARLDLAVNYLRSGTQNLVSVTYNLVWEKGDWKMLPEDTSDPVLQKELSSPDGYIPWAAEPQSNT